MDKLCEIADFLKNSKLYLFAEKLHSKVLNLRKDILSPNHMDIGTSMNSLAGVLQKLNRLT